MSIHGCTVATTTGAAGKIKKDMLPKILLVEDEAHLLECYTDALCGRYRVVPTSSGKEALRQAKLQRDIDLAVVDFRLPDIPGTEILTDITRMRPPIPVIMITGHGSEDVAVKAFRCGAKDYLKKPFSPNELTEKIDFLLSLRCSGGICAEPALFRDTKTLDPAQGAPGSHDRIQEVIQYLDGNYMAETSLRKAANLACMSERHFSRTFKKVAGVPYRAYVNGLRVKKAGEMLKNTAHTVTAISLEVGYNDLTCFERIFKKITGKTPSHYRACQN